MKRLSAGLKRQQPAATDKPRKYGMRISAWTPEKFSATLDACPRTYFLSD
jgi:hypothetical protein